MALWYVIEFICYKKYIHFVNKEVCKQNNHPNPKLNKVSDTNAFYGIKAFAIKWTDKKDLTMLLIVHTNTMADVKYNNKIEKKKKKNL